MKRLRAVLPGLWASVRTLWISRAERVGVLERARWKSHMRCLLLGFGGAKYTPRFFGLAGCAEARAEGSRWREFREVPRARKGEAREVRAGHFTRGAQARAGRGSKTCQDKNVDSSHDPPSRSRDGESGRRVGTASRRR